MSLPVAIIGAGPSGLAACKVLGEFGLPYRCFEMAHAVGGTWRFDGDTACYASLRTNTSKRSMAFSDYDLPEAYPDFPSHDELLAWFNDYVDHFGFRKNIAFNARVTNLARHNTKHWNIEVDGQNAGDFSAVIVATGNYRKPRLPDFPGAFEGPTLHGHDYIDPTRPIDFRSKRVLVVGLGSTAADIASELAEEGNAANVFLATRSGAYIFPRQIRHVALDARLQHPAEEPQGLLRALPRPFRDALFYTTGRKMIRRVQAIAGWPQDVGLPAPPQDPRTKRTTVSDGLLKAVAEKRITPKPNVARLHADAVEFEDASIEPIDVIVYAIGYHAHFPFLGEDILDGNHDDDALYRGIMHPKFHDLFIVGLFRPLCAFWPRTEQQVRWIIPILQGQYRIPNARGIARHTYPVLKSPTSNCSFYTHDLRRDTARRQR